MLYSSLDSNSGNGNEPPADANSYRFFKVVDSAVTNNIQKELALIEGVTEERGLQAASSQFALLRFLPAPIALVGALTKALCCMRPHQPFSRRV